MVAWIEVGDYHDLQMTCELTCGNRTPQNDLPRERTNAPRSGGGNHYKLKKTHKRGQMPRIVAEGTTTS